MTKKGANTGFILLGTGVALAVAMSITGVVVFNKRKRQAEYDYLIKVINDNLDSATAAGFKGGAFDKDLYKKTPNCATIDSAKAKQLSDKLWNAKSIFNDDEESVESVFKNVSNRCDVSRIADHFYNVRDNNDLLLHLKSFLDNDELEKYVFAYTSKLK